MKQEIDYMFYDRTLQRINDAIDMLISIDVNLSIIQNEYDVRFSSYYNGKDIREFYKYLKNLEKELMIYKEKRDAVSISD